MPSSHSSARPARRRAEALLMRVAHPPISWPYGNGVLQVRATRLDDVRVVRGFRGKRVAQPIELLADHFGELQVREPHGCRRDIVGGLRHVHVIVGIDVLVGPEAAAADLIRAVRDDLVDVHVE
jgi:hypothetical protein